MFYLMLINVKTGVISLEAFKIAVDLVKYLYDLNEDSRGNHVWHFTVWNYAEDCRDTTMEIGQMLMHYIRLKERRKKK